MTDCSLNLLTFRSCLLPSVLFSLSPFMWVLKLNLSLASSLLGRICLLTSKFQGNLVPVSPTLGLQLHTLLLFFICIFIFYHGYPGDLTQVLCTMSTLWYFLRLKSSLLLHISIKTLSLFSILQTLWVMTDPLYLGQMRQVKIQNIIEQHIHDFVVVVCFQWTLWHHCYNKIVRIKKIIWFNYSTNLSPIFQFPIWAIYFHICLCCVSVCRCTCVYIHGKDRGQPQVSSCWNEPPQVGSLAGWLASFRASPAAYFWALGLEICATTFSICS